MTDAASLTHQGTSPENTTREDAMPKTANPNAHASGAHDPAGPPTDRPAASEDTLTAPRDLEISRTDTARTDPMRADPNRAEPVRTVGHQLVEAVRQGANGTTDVALNPEELGRVRLSMTTQDGVLHVSVLAERPETHDLLRRNIGLLQSDFRALGYTDVAFDFGPGGDSEGRSGRATEHRPEAAPVDGSPDASPPAVGTPDGNPRTIAASARLDLRL
jgi:flagellar hook-length control protein FliK